MALRVLPIVLPLPEMVMMETTHQIKPITELEELVDLVGVVEAVAMGPNSL